MFVFLGNTLDSKIAVFYYTTSYCAPNMDSLTYFYSIDSSIMYYVFHTEMTDLIFLVLQALLQRR